MTSTLDIAWAAGFLEGEGSFVPSSCRVSAVQKQREPLERLRRIFGGHIITQRKRDGRELGYWYLGSHPGAAVMMTLYPLMSPRRREQIRHALAHWRTLKVSERFRVACPRGHAYVKRNAFGSRVCRECHLPGGFRTEQRRARDRDRRSLEVRR